ncbi:hypothetical protein ABK040_007535 [Willaertia magna]
MKFTEFDRNTNTTVNEGLAFSCLLEGFPNVNGSRSNIKFHLDAKNSSDIIQITSFLILNKSNQFFFSRDVNLVKSRKGIFKFEKGNFTITNRETKKSEEKRRAFTIADLKKEALEKCKLIFPKLSKRENCPLIFGVTVTVNGNCTTFISEEKVVAANKHEKCVDNDLPCKVFFCTEKNTLQFHNNNTCYTLNNKENDSVINNDNQLQSLLSFSDDIEFENVESNDIITEKENYTNYAKNEALPLSAVETNIIPGMVSFYGESETEEEEDDTCRVCKKRKKKRKISKTNNTTNKLTEENNDLKKQNENLKAVIERKDNQIYTLQAQLKEAQMKIENQKTVEQQPALPVGWSDEIDLTEFFFEK